MHFFKRQAFLTFLFTITVFALFTSCMPDAGDTPSQLVVQVHLDDLDSTLTAGSDSLKIKRVRFIHGNSFFTLSDSSTLQLRLESQLSFSESVNNSTIVLINSIFPEDVYEKLTFKIVRAKAVPDTVPRYNPDEVFTEEGSYSIVVNGTFNGKDFTFKASKPFTYVFEFVPPVTVTSETKLYGFLISAKVKSWFINNQGSGFLNPADGKKKELIYTNISNSFEIDQLSPEN